ncbi:methylated-DNA--[protein]-cysteine S-methyltransferase [Kaistia terrae]|uniref:Methylated-DNA--[protein]-cysteine S-methyltransferase n=1 Tax=Kaistia terrae TaxID=537017 RepID=A0ABW0Q018_9HYPH|nr:methylated-DNA--[protein]-cysteine S-methyltransferase [Kaistia terrae]MCX5578869.1 methylated-DNA--[protein]-cysteine S-methyltransferase [Kaistia terrae]
MNFHALTAGRQKMRLTMETISTPIGDMRLAADADGFLRAADFADCDDRLAALLQRRFGVEGFSLTPGKLAPAIGDAFAAYFEGEISAIDRIQVKTGGTAFQQTVWQALRAIAPGSALAYGRLAEQLGKPQSARAVGHANGANPFNIVIPCHRLVGANGALTGYAGGIHRKRWLLDHEARHAPSA